MSGAEFGDDRPGDNTVHPRNRDQVLDLIFIGLDPSLDLCLQASDLALKEFEMGQGFSKHPSLAIRKVPLKG